MSMWEDDAACRVPWIKTEWFFPAEEDVPRALRCGRTRESNLRARAVCSSCPVIKQCLKANLDAEFGVFGGFTAPEREAIREGRAIPTRRPTSVMNTEERQVFDGFMSGMTMREACTFYGHTERWREAYLVEGQISQRLQAVAQEQDQEQVA